MKSRVIPSIPWVFSWLYKFSQVFPQFFPSFSSKFPKWTPWLSGAAPQRATGARRRQLGQDECAGAAEVLQGGKGSGLGEASSVWLVDADGGGLLVEYWWIIGGFLVKVGELASWLSEFMDYFRNWLTMVLAGS